MAENHEPYISSNPGDLITSENWNQMQVMIKKDLQSQVESAKEEIRAGKVKEAENAEKFAQSGPKEWLDKLDERYAMKTHGHEGESVYRRYIKRFTEEINEVLLQHELGRFPIVDVYELKPVTRDPEYADCKLLVYYGHVDAEKLKLYKQVYREKVYLGYPLEQLLTELGVQYEDDDNLEDVINDLWTAFMKDPNDEIKHCVSKWIQDSCNKKRTVADLKQTDQWPDLHVAIYPRKCGKGTDLLFNYTISPPEPTGPFCHAEITQVNYNTLHIQVPKEYFQVPPPPTGELQDPELTLMFLLRI
ncbi:MAG: hypothetical protein Kow0042_16770 [Calditrichia bacterium]